nr:hypothetical protein CFP56_07107 [Quercus suber]
MVPASSNQSRWCLFTTELDRFLSGSNTVWMEGKTSDEAIGGDLTDGGHNMLKGDIGITVYSINGRPTREFTFELTSANLVLKVSKLVRGKKVSESVVGESSRPPMESTVISVMPEASTTSISPISSSDQALELLTSNPTRVLGDPEVGKSLASRSSSVAEALDFVKASSSMGSVSNAEVIFVDEFVEGEDHEEEQRSYHHDNATLQRSMNSVGEFQSDSRLHLLLRETSEVFDHSCGSGERYLCVGV